MSSSAGKTGWRWLPAALWMGIAFASEPDAGPVGDLGRRMMAEWSAAKPEQIEMSWDEKTGTLTITQKAKCVAVDWKGTASNPECTLRFRSEVPHATLLVRVTGGRPTVLDKLFWEDAGQEIVFINPAGVLVGPKAMIGAGRRTTLSTLDIPSFEFEGPDEIRTITDGGGDLRFLGNIAPSSNPEETVALAAGGEIIVAEGTSGQDKNPEGTAGLKAHGNVYALAINRDGVIRANGSQRVSGRIVLPGDSEAGKEKEDTGKHVLQIDQSSKKAIIHWRTTWVSGKDEALELNQPSKDSVAIFRYNNRPEGFVPPRVRAIGRVYFDNGDGTMTRIDEAGYGGVSKTEEVPNSK